MYVTYVCMCFRLVSAGVRDWVDAINYLDTNRSRHAQTTLILIDWLVWTVFFCISWHYLNGSTLS